MTPPHGSEFPHTPGVILAGGQSSRMGRVKALLPWPGTQRTFVVQVAETLRAAGARPVGVVTGAHHAAVATALQGSGISVVFNPRHAQGQLASLQHGLAWAFAETSGDWALVTLVDVPGVTGETVRLLLDAARRSTALIVRPAIGARHGHPVVWHRETVARLAAADPAQGGRAVVRALAAAGQVLDVPVADTGVLVDIDTPEDYARARDGGRDAMPLPDLTQLTLLAIEAARTGDVVTLRHTLAAGVPVDSATPDGESLLRLATRGGHLAAARVLLDAGADTDAPEAEGRRVPDVSS